MIETTNMLNVPEEIFSYWQASTVRIGRMRMHCAVLYTVGLETKTSFYVRHRQTHAATFCAIRNSSHKTYNDINRFDRKFCTACHEHPSSLPDTFLIFFSHNALTFRQLFLTTLYCPPAYNPATVNPFSYSLFLSLLGTFFYYKN